MAETVVQGIFPWCFTPGLHAARPDHIQALAEFVRGRPPQPVDLFLRQADAVIAHDVEPHLGRIAAPTQITFGRHDQVTSTRFAARILAGIRGAELVVFEDCAHAPIHQRPEAFNRATLSFLRRHSGVGPAA